MDSNAIEENMSNELSNEEFSSETIEHLEQKNIFDDEVSEADFNLTLAGILSDNVNANNINEVLQSKPIKAGIWVSESSRTSFLSFLNEHTIYTYSVNNEGYLICDNIRISFSKNEKEDNNNNCNYNNRYNTSYFI